MEVYLDNSATTRCSDGARDIMIKALQEDYGNTSSLHLKGLEAERYIKEARSRIARTLKVQEKELIFTSGGTEADNLAVLGAARANSRAGKHLITTCIEHAAVSAAMEELVQEGFEVTWLDVDSQGLISLEQLGAAIRPDTILVSMMYVNNEIGAVEPIAEAAKLIKEKNPRTLFHVDAIQAYGKYTIYPARLGIDLLAVSGHKIHGPKGVGFLYAKDRTKLRPLMLGGGHQNGMRSGTENVPGVAGLGVAAQEAYQNLDEKREQLYQLREALIRGLEGLEWAHINGPLDRTAAPQIVSVSFDRVRSEVLLHALEERGIYASAGSACSSNKPAVCRTLKSIGLNPRYLDSTLRFSFSVENTLEEIAYTVKTLQELVPMLMKYTRH